MFMSATLRANIFGVTSCLKGEGGGREIRLVVIFSEFFKDIFSEFY